MVEVLKTYTGAELAGVRYEPIFLVADHSGAFQILIDSFVSTENQQGLSIWHLRMERMTIGFVGQPE